MNDLTEPHDSAPLSDPSRYDHGNADVTGLERETDRLIELLAHHYEMDPESPLFSDVRTFEWLCRELRAAADEGMAGEHVEGFSEREAMEIAARLCSSASAERSGVRAIDAACRLRSAPIAATVAGSVDEAAWYHCAPRIDMAPAAGEGVELWDEVCDQWVELPEDVPRGRYVALGVSGKSMDPLLHTGDVILVRLDGVAVPGSIIVARNAENGYVVKRVANVAGLEIELRSLNAEFPPITIRRDGNAVLGTVILRWCTHFGGSSNK